MTRQQTEKRSNGAEADVLDLETGHWSTTPITARTSTAAATVGAKALFAGGQDGFTPSSVVDIYDGATRRWSTAKLAEARSGPSAATVGSLALFAGGAILHSLAPITQAQWQPSNVVDLYDARTNRWAAAKLSQARYNIAVTTVGTKVLFAGGQGAPRRKGDVNPSDVVDIYDTATGRWSSTRLPHVPAYPGQVVDGATSVRARAFFSSGEVVDIYDTVGGTWSTTRPAAAGVGVFAATVGTKAVFVGGKAVADVYDASTDRWSSVALVEDPGVHATVGTQLVFAGTSTTSAEGVADIYTDAAPSPALSGYMGSGKTAAVILNNTGDAALAGPFIVNVYANHQRAVDSHAVLVGQVRVEQSLPAGGSIRVKVAISPPVTLAAGTYTLLAAVNKARHVTVFASQIGGLTVAAAGEVKATLPAEVKASVPAATGGTRWLADEANVLA